MSGPFTVTLLSYSHRGVETDLMSKTLWLKLELKKNSFSFTVLTISIRANIWGV